MDVKFDADELQQLGRAFNNPDEYLDVLAELISDHLAPRVLHEVERLLPKGF